MNFVEGGLDPVDLDLAELDPRAQLLTTRSDDPVRLLEAEGDEQQAGLVDMAVVAVDDGDLGLVSVEPLKAVRDKRSAGPRFDDDDPVPHAQILCRAAPQCIRGKPQNRGPLSPIGDGRDQD